VSCPIIRLREAAEHDCDRVFAWANDSETLAASFRSDSIPLEEHRAWYAQTLERGRTLFILESDGVFPVGLARLDPIGVHAAEVGLIIAPECRGRGLAARAIAAVIAGAAAEQFTHFVAKIRPTNARSQRAFLRAGFVLDGEEVVAGVRALRYVFGP
jgi:RimJ/RimL family protein N-acetyltransferase